MKKRITLLLLIFLSSGIVCFSQPPRGERFQKAQMALGAYLTKELSLTPDESEKLKPVYKNYFMDLKNAKQENTTDPIAKDEKILTLRKKYKEEFKKILNSEERVNKLFLAERNFKDILRKELIDRRMNTGGMREGQVVQ